MKRFHSEIKNIEYECIRNACKYSFVIQNTSQNAIDGKIGIFGRIRKRGFQLKSGTSAGVVYIYYKLDAGEQKNISGEAVFDKEPSYIRLHLVNELN